MFMRSFNSKIIGYKKGEYFIAVALEFDIVTQGDTLMEALNNLNDAVKGYLLVGIQDNETDEQIYRKAPKKYFDLYNLFLEFDEDKRKSRKYEDRFLASMKFDKSNLCVR